MTLHLKIFVNFKLNGLNKKVKQYGTHIHWKGLLEAIKENTVHTYNAELDRELFNSIFNEVHGTRTKPERLLYILILWVIFYII